MLSFFNCSSDKTIIYGQYLTNHGKSLRGYRIQFGFIGEDKERYNYYTYLSKNGKFKIKIKEKGIFTAFLGLNQYPARDVVPFKSNNDGRFYTINTIKNKKILIDKYLYITEPLKIFSPTDEDKIFMKSDQIIEWEKDIFADYYTLSFTRRNEENRTILANFTAYINIKDNSIRVKDFFNLPVIEEDLQDYDTTMNLMPFARTYGEIISEKYLLRIRGNKIAYNEENLLAASGRKIIPGEKRSFTVSESEEIFVELFVK
jgi:hypothetical protein